MEEGSKAVKEDMQYKVLEVRDGDRRHKEKTLRLFSDYQVKCLSHCLAHCRLLACSLFLFARRLYRGLYSKAVLKTEE